MRTGPCLPRSLRCGPRLCRPRLRRQDEGDTRRQAEVPPNTSAATGTAEIDYDPASKKLSWKVTYSGLSGPATAAHFHGPAKAGKNAGVAVAIPNAGTARFKEAPR